MQLQAKKREEEEERALPIKKENIDNYINNRSNKILKLRKN